MVFHWRLSDSKSPQVSGTLLSILAVFNYAVFLDGFHSAANFQIFQALLLLLLLLFSWNHIIDWKLLVPDRNTCYHLPVQINDY